MDKKQWSEIFFVAVGAMATAVYAYYTIQLVNVTKEYTKVTKESTEITRTSFEATNRPWIFSNTVRVHKRDPRARLGATIVVSLENVGNFPAHNIDTTSTIEVERIGINQKLPPVVASPSVIFPNQDNNVLFAIGEDIYSHMVNGLHMVHFHVYIDYKGALEKQHRTEQSFSILGLGDQSMRPEQRNMLFPTSGKYK